jgi:hypothetical protein
LFAQEKSPRKNRWSAVFMAEDRPLLDGLAGAGPDIQARQADTPRRSAATGSSASTIDVAAEPVSEQGNRRLADPPQSPPDG